jgi:hypothetical protein
MTHVFGEYLRLFVWPVNLSSDYSGFPHATTLTTPVLLSAAALATVAIAVLMAARRGRTEPLFWLAWAALAFAPVSNLLAMTGIVMAERVAYLPSVAIAAAGGAGAAWLIARRRAFIALPALLILAGAALSWQQSKIWSDSRHLAEETLAHARYAGDLTQQALVWELLREDDERHDPALMQRALPLARAAQRPPQPRPPLRPACWSGWAKRKSPLWQSLLAEAGRVALPSAGADPPRHALARRLGRGGHGVRAEVGGDGGVHGYAGGGYRSVAGAADITPATLTPGYFPPATTAISGPGVSSPAAL